MPFPKWLPIDAIPKPLIPILVVAGGISLTLVVLSQREKMRSLEGQLHIGRQQIQQLEAERVQLEAERQTLSRELESRDGRLRTLREELAAASTNLDQTRASLEALQARFREMDTTHTTLAAQITTISRERDETRQQNQKLVEEKSDLDRSVVRLRERFTLLDRDYRQLAEQLANAQMVPHGGVSAVTALGPSHHATLTSIDHGATISLAPGTVELPPIVVRKDQAGMSMPVRGRIVEVNEPHNFIVVDQGSMDGVHVGMMFDIVRGISTIGRATVVRVRPQLSACDILRTRTPGPLQAGDQAVQSGISAR